MYSSAAHDYLIDIVGPELFNESFPIVAIHRVADPAPEIIADRPRLEQIQGHFVALALSRSMGQSHILLSGHVMDLVVGS